MRSTWCLAFAVLAVGCSPPARRQAPSATESATPIPFEDVKTTEKILMGKWGTIVVGGEYRDDDASPIQLAKGVTLDIAYARRSESGDIDGRVAIGHEELGGATLPAPDLARMPGADVTTTDCAGTGELTTKDGTKGRYLCASGSLGKGIVATLRKGGRVYHFVCAEQGSAGIATCVSYAQSFTPS